MTSLFPDIIFGPVRSRRLGLSLGVNLLPTRSKLCSFDCIYCECGWNAEHPGARRFNDRDDVRTQLEATLRRMVADGTPPTSLLSRATESRPSIPTSRPSSATPLPCATPCAPGPKSPCCRTPRSSTATTCGGPLLRVDNNILKLDSAFDATVRRMNNPQNAAYTVRETVEQMKRFEGRMILQTMFLRELAAVRPSTTPPRKRSPRGCGWSAKSAPAGHGLLARPRHPLSDTRKVPREELQTIAARIEALGIPCSVA